MDNRKAWVLAVVATLGASVAGISVINQGPPQVSSHTSFLHSYVPALTDAERNELVPLIVEGTVGGYSQGIVSQDPAYAPQNLTEGERNAYELGDITLTKVAFNVEVWVKGTSPSAIPIIVLGDGESFKFSEPDIITSEEIEAAQVGKRFRVWLSPLRALDGHWVRAGSKIL